MITLRPYQERAIELLRWSVAQHRRTILTIPTGGGKTTVAAFMVKEALTRGRRILFMAHRKELIDQAANRFRAVGLSPGIIMGADTAIDPMLNVASVQTLRNRLTFILPPDLIIIDEAHLSMAASYRAIIDAFPDAYIVGLTATPRRLDGKPLGDIYRDIVAPISIAGLVEAGNLVPARYYAAVDKADMTGVATVAGDFATNQAFARFDKPKLYDGVVKHYLERAQGSSFICFCVNVEHSQKTAEAFRMAGVNCVHIDGETPPGERHRLTTDFQHGRITGVCNVGLFTEGFDVPHIGTVILNRATQSEALFLQMVGRGLRPYPGKSHLTVLDHGGNVLDRHGFHDDERTWSLTGKKKKKTDKVGAFGVKLCPRCNYMMHVSITACPECYYEYPRTPADGGKVIQGAEFVELQRKPPLPSHLKKKWSDMTEVELKELAEIRGFKKGWVYHQLKLQRNKV